MTFIISPSLQRAATIIAATLIALASGTNYAYSAWSPQFAHRMHLSSTKINLIGTAANLGMYATGAFTGKFTDSRGPRPSGFIGALCIVLGYFPLQKAYDNGPGSMNMFFLCFFSFLTGVGGCVAFQCSLKTAATNFPRHRGTATAFPLAAYGLSAFFFSSISAVAFHDDTGSFLMLLAIAPGLIALISTFFIKTFPASSSSTSSSSYKSIPAEERSQHQQQHISRLSISRGGYTEPGTQETTPLCSDDAPSASFASSPFPPSSSSSSSSFSSNLRDIEAGYPSTSMVVDNTTSTTTATASTTKADSEGMNNTTSSSTAKATTTTTTTTTPAQATAKAEPGAATGAAAAAAANDGRNAMAVDETSSLMSRRNSTCSDSSDDMPPTASHHHSLYTDVRGWNLLRKIEFWQLVALLGLLSGIGLMTINNIGNDVKSLWVHWDHQASSAFIQKQQVLQVSILSIFSCGGRLLSGIGSDVLVNRLHVSRVWCLFVSSLIFCFAQIAATQITNPHHLVIISSTTGIAYGFLFGVFPSIVAHVFGVGGLSQNWGIMCLAPVLSGNVFNLMYGSIYDQHSIVEPNGERGCEDGVDCYRATYQFAVVAGVAGAGVALWTIWHEKRVVERLHEGGKERD